MSLSLKRITNLSIKSKIMLIICVAFIGLIIMAGQSVLSLNTLKAGIDENYEVRYSHTHDAYELQTEIIDLANIVLAHIISDNKEEQDLYAEQIKGDFDQITETINHYKSVQMTPEGTKLIAEIETLMSTYLANTEQCLELSAAGKTKEAEAFRLSNIKPIREKVIEVAKSLVEMNNQGMLQNYQSSSELTQNSIIIAIVVSIVTLAVLIVISWIIIQDLISRLNLLLNGMNTVKSGDLTWRVNLSGMDELSSVSSAFDGMTESLEQQKREISENLEKSQDTNAAIADVAQKILEGDTKALIDEERYDGEFKIIVNGVNKVIASFVTPINEIRRMVHEFAIGNFAVRYDTNTEVKGDFALLRDALDDSAKTVGVTIVEIQTSVSELVTASEELIASAEEVAASTRIISDGSANISDYAEKSAYSMKQVLQAMEDLNHTVNDVAIKTEQVSKISSEATSLSKDGINIVSQAEHGMSSITAATSESKDIVDEITRQMGEVGRIVEIIREISDQTGLLALNAAIEAARAGEAGLGFAVVADEVKSLAQETQRSAEEIANVITELQNYSDKAGKSMEKATVEVSSGEEALRNAVNSFNMIVELIREINTHITDVAAASEEQAASVEEITASIHEVTNLTSSTSDEAGKGSQSLEEVSKAISEITVVITNVGKNIEAISEKVEYFRT